MNIETYKQSCMLAEKGGLGVTLRATDLRALLAALDARRERGENGSDLAEARERIALLEMALRQVEWVTMSMSPIQPSSDWTDMHSKYCPWCEAVKFTGHQPMCPRQVALEG